MISIALATYNGGEFIRNQIESLLSQTLAFDELVICDDNSKDNTVEILQEYARVDSRIKVYFNEENIGFKKNFEKAVSLCSGEYIALCDQDDIWLPHHLKTLYENMGDQYLVCGSSETMDVSGRPQGKTIQQILNYCKSPDIENLSTAGFIILYNNPFQGASMMITKEFSRKALPIPESIRFHDVWLASLACLYNKFKYVDEIITYYRLHENNASGKHLHHTRIRTLIGHFVKKELKINRCELVEELYINGEFMFDEKSVNLLRKIYFYHRRRKNIFGRFYNLLFEIWNWGIIFGEE